MKKFILLLTCLFTFLCVAAEVDYRRPRFYRLPPMAQSFIDQNFPGRRVLDIDLEDGGRYEVELSGDIEIKFHRNGRWYKIKSERRGVPYAVLPTVVKHRVCDRFGYPVRIDQVKRNGDVYEVKLANHRKMKIRRGDSYRPDLRPHPNAGSNRPW